MHPILCTIGNVPVYSYTVIIVLDIIAVTLLFLHDARPLALPRRKLAGLIVGALVFGAIGARLTAMLFNVDSSGTLTEQLLSQKGFFFPGIIFFGGIFTWIYGRKNALPVGKLLDVGAPICALFQAIIRAGCFLNGCCYGKPVWWGVYYPAHGTVLHPTQLYLLWGSLLIFIVLRRFNKGNLYPGRVFVVYLILESLMRFAVDFVRVGNPPVAAGLSLYQFIVVVFMGIFLYVFRYLKRRR